MRAPMVCALFVLTGCAIAEPWTYEPPTECPATAGLAYSMPQQPNLMLVVDRSCSMSNSGECDQSPCGSRWDQVLALTPLLDDLEKASRVGLTVFPSQVEECDVEEGILVPISDEDDADVYIAEALADVVPGGSTPMLPVLDAMREEGHLQDPHRDNVVVLLTDGVPSCDCRGGCDANDAVRAVEKLTGGDVPVELYVIGFGVTDEASELLAGMAEAARPTTDGENYFEADSVEELYERIYQVGASLDACQFELDEPVPMEDLLVYVAGAETPPCMDSSCMYGYAYDPSQGRVQLAPGACRDLGGAECPDIRFERR